jgi:hypothetical protein
MYEKELALEMYAILFYGREKKAGVRRALNPMATANSNFIKAHTNQFDQITQPYTIILQSIMSLMAFRWLKLNFTAKYDFTFYFANLISNILSKA